MRPDHCENGENRMNQVEQGAHVPAARATVVGLCAILLWSLMTALVRIVADAFGATLGSALIYTFGVALLMIFHRPAPLRLAPRRYLIVGGALFVFYESAISLSIGLAPTSIGSVEVSLVNYMWPTMMVLLSAALARPKRQGAVCRALPGAVVATAGVILAVGGNSGLDPTAALRHVTADPLPYALAFAGALAWSIYAVITPGMARGYDGTSVFFPLVAVALWVIHFASSQGWPQSAPGPIAWLAAVGAGAVIAGGYACWGYGILHGSLNTLAVASYATPILSATASAVMLRLTLSLPFWCGAALVVVGSLINLRVSRRG